MGALRARRRFAAITGSKFRIKSYPLLASSQHVGATAAVTILFIMFVQQKTILGLPGLLKQLLIGTVFSDCFVSDCFLVHFHTSPDCFVLDCFVWDCFLQTR